MKILDVFNKEYKKTKIDFPYIIAEIGVNHGCNMNTAKRLIDEAKEGGANAVKFQTYKAETIASKDSPYYWDISKEPSQSQYELFQKYDKFEKQEFEQLKYYCDKTDIEFLSTPFDVESALFLNDLMDVYKISSSDITNKPFIELIGRFNKPIILSTGASNHEEIQRAVDWIEPTRNPLCLMHCVLNYPTKNKDANLGMILDLKEQYPQMIIGYSDHTLPEQMKTLELATLLGAIILEKHFTYDKTLQGNDHYHAMDKNDLKIFKKNLSSIFELLGSFEKYSLASEECARQNARRSLVAKQTIPKGKRIEIEHLTWKRPANGICPSEITKVVGCVAIIDVKKDTVILPSMIATSEYP
jgi:N-acetylneuraminate synthase